MRLWLSVTVLLMLTCVALEISAAKSKRDADTSTDNSKSTDPKDVRYSKNKSDQKKKGKSKEQEVVKDKKRRSIEGSETVDGNGVSKKDKKGRDVKLSKEEQKRQKSNKQEKIDKNGESYKKEKTIVKVGKETGKKQKRSAEFEQPKKTVIDDTTGGSAKKELESQSNSATKKVAKSKSEKKSKKTLDSEKESDVIASAEEVAKNEPPKTTSWSNMKTGSSKTEKKIVDENQGSLKKVKKQKHTKKSEENVKPRKGETKHEKVQTSDREAEDRELENSKYLNDSPEKSYYLNEDGLIKEKQAGSKNCKKDKSPKKSSETVPACGREVNEKLTFPEQRAKVYESDSCNVEADCLPDKNIENAERSKYFAHDLSQSNLEDIELDEVENEAPKSKVDQELTEES